MTIRRRLVSLGATAALALGAVVAVSPGSAQAASGCWGNAGTKTDPEGRTYTARFCHNYQGGDVYLYRQPIGYLNAGDNWFVCQSKVPDFPNPPVGDARNDWWLYTQGDTGSQHNAWGYFPANKVSGGNNYDPIPGLPVC